MEIVDPLCRNEIDSKEHANVPTACHSCQFDFATGIQAPTPRHIHPRQLDKQVELGSKPSKAGRDYLSDGINKNMRAKSDESTREKAQPSHGMEPLGDI
jgi:hypothetical protein